MLKREDDEDGRAISGVGLALLPVELVERMQAEHANFIAEFDEIKLQPGVHKLVDFYAAVEKHGTCI